MIGLFLLHRPSGAWGMVDAEVGEPGGELLVRIADRWFLASEMVAVTR